MYLENHLKGNAVKNHFEAIYHLSTIDIKRRPISSVSALIMRLVRFLLSLNWQKRSGK